MRNVIRLIVVLSFLSMQGMAQHNSDYIHYMFNGLLINPSYAGSQEALNVTALYRKQWLGLNGAPTDAILSIHSPLKNKKLNLGAVLINEQFGIYNHTKADLIYAYRIRFLKGKLSFGLQAGVDSYSTNWGKINTQEPGDPNFTPSATRTIKPQAGAGTYYNSKNFYFGLALPNLFDGSFNSYFMTTITSGCIIKASEDFRIKPAVLLKYINHSPVSANISTTFYYREHIGLGLGYTYNNSAMAYTDIRINEQLNLGYGYAYMLNTLSGYTHGSHEIMLRYLFRYKINAVSARYF